MPYVTSTVSFRPNQFAYTNQRGSRDALAHLVLTWLVALSKGRKAAVYCSDVSGAFDRVSVKRLLQKLEAKRIHKQIVAVIAPWLRERQAYVAVGGEKSAGITSKDMVYQGTVWGPALWNIFYEGA